MFTVTFAHKTLGQITNDLRVAPSHQHAIDPTALIQMLHSISVFVESQLTQKHYHNAVAVTTIQIARFVISLCLNSLPPVSVPAAQQDLVRFQRMNDKRHENHNTRGSVISSQ